MSYKHDILQSIIEQNTNKYKGFQLDPLWITVKDNTHQVLRPEILTEVSGVGSLNYQEVSDTIWLGNDLLILTGNEIDIPINSTLTLESLNNLFIITKAEYTIINYYKYQVFSNYIKISLKDFGSYVPFQLEFLRIIPTIWRITEK